MLIATILCYRANDLPRTAWVGSEKAGSEYSPDLYDLVGASLSWMDEGSSAGKSTSSSTTSAIKVKLIINDIGSKLKCKYKKNQFKMNNN